VTTRLSTRKKVAIPNEVCERLGLKAGDGFDVLCSESGQIMLVPIRRKGEKGLLDAFRALSGLKIPPRNKELIRPIKL
jgi:AbrB family looped-hinge helix DNA binding protein